MDFQNKTVVVTGANGGMGKVITERFLAEGAKVTALDLKINRLEELRDRYKESFIPLSVNLIDESEVNQAIASATDFMGGISVLVNTVGVAQAAANIEDVSLEEWDKIIRVNTTSLFLTSKAVVKSMKKQRSGVITNIASIAAERPRPGLNAYVASKGGALAFTKALAIELAEYKIRVNGINPGPSDTSMLGKFSPAGGNVDEVKDKTFMSSVPLGELVTPEDIAEAVMYLSSDRAKMVTGSVLNVDGGRGL
ncbi:3-oxoacyl-[acyl-carrier protein] reductase [Thalassobacillus cyri]|uniref:3-oxoacyl-[acyl-carrier protein] reductase n=1 Tax=Thalassobacillus cyri TaxID=571932 RepID=A0A1H4E4L4_9BACI|nr:glucose 1-dehydrogenase [Thalassobacillus cyri]SEA79500.1 3-oxoacyl-[acyl-carrier protein] reductase [Thalassobacillus cyri]